MVTGLLTFYFTARDATPLGWRRFLQNIPFIFVSVGLLPGCATVRHVSLFHNPFFAFRRNYWSMRFSTA
jgi:hypothetical protein